MSFFNSSEAWRQIPPEEKIELLSEAHSRGVIAVFFFLLTAATLAVGFQFSELFWCALLASPVVFQSVSSMRWRALRPLLILQYLAARTAARRYAYQANSADMGLQLIFRGELEHTASEDNAMSALNAAVSNNQSVSVWITLFNDAVVILSERHGGAELEFAQIITDRLSIAPVDPDQPEYTNDRKLILAHDDPDYGTYSVTISSHQPAAISVFEKQLRHLITVPRLERIESAE